MGREIWKVLELQMQWANSREERKEGSRQEIASKWELWEQN